MIKLVLAVVSAAVVALGAAWLALFKVPAELDGVGRVLAIAAILLAGGRALYNEVSTARQHFQHERNAKLRRGAKAALKATCASCVPAYGSRSPL